MIEEVNKYTPDYKNKFCNLWPQVSASHLIQGQKEATILKAALNDTVYIPTRQFCYNNDIVDILPFYYLDYLALEREDFVLDLGCGVNPFKKFVTNLQGLDADKNANYDILDHFDADYVQGHKGIWSKIIAINSIHFAPITQVAYQLNLLAELLENNGRAFVATNLETWLMHTEPQIIKNIFGDYPNFRDIVEYFDQQVKQTGLKLLVYDWPILDSSYETSIRDDYNGNIRLVFQLC
jgi:hypothetical protein